LKYQKDAHIVNKWKFHKLTMYFYVSSMYFGKLKSNVPYWSFTLFNKWLVTQKYIEFSVSFKIYNKDEVLPGDLSTYASHEEKKTHKLWHSQ
jgi:hypothetical protein